MAGTIHLVPAGWSLRTESNVEFTRAVEKISDATRPEDLFGEDGWDDGVVAPLSDPREGPPLPERSDGIGPGSHLIISRPDGTFGCTASFVWKEDGGDVYLGSAGHCFLPETRTATHGPGADYDPAATHVRVCLSGCTFGGQSGFIFTGFTVGLGPVVYARQQLGTSQLGHDFGLVKIPSQWSDFVRPHMPVWNGPVGSGSVSLGAPVVHYGHAAGFGETFLTQARAGIGSSSSGTTWLANTLSAPGDSGSAVSRGVLTQDDQAIEGQLAVGTLTHLTLGLGIVGGTTLNRGIAMASSDAGLSITLIKQGEEAFTAPAAPQELRATAGPGRGEITLNWVAPTSHGGAGVAQYNVYRTGGAGTSLAAQVSAPTHSFTDGSLPDNSSWTYHVTAVNDKGEGPPTNSAEATAFALPGVPRNVTAEAESGNVTLSWEPPAEDRGTALLQYVVRYNATVGDRSSGKVATNETNLLVTGLHNGWTYEFTVAAVNSIGEGNPSDPVVAMPLPRPAR